MKEEAFKWWRNDVLFILQPHRATCQNPRKKFKRTRNRFELPCSAVSKRSKGSEKNEIFTPII